MKTTFAICILLLVIGVETWALWRMRSALVADASEGPVATDVATASERERCRQSHGNFYRYAYGYVVCEKVRT